MGMFLALDVGGTKTDYLLANEHRVLARVRTGSIKRMRTDAGTATAFLEAGLAELTKQTGVNLQSVDRTCIGTAGNTVPLVTDWLRAEVGGRVGGAFLLMGDVDIALDAAFPGQAGVLVLAGTGSNVAGRGRDGAVMTAGGWGPALSDQGSGHRIGQQALRAAAMAYDARQPTLLLDRILAHWQLASFDHLVEHANAAPAPDASKLVPTVVECAAEGDRLAQEVLRQQGEELGEVVLLLLHRLRAQAGDKDFAPPIAFAGSIMESVPAVRAGLMSTIRREFPEVKELAGVVDPPFGALWRARSGVGFGSGFA